MARCLVTRRVPGERTRSARGRPRGRRLAGSASAGARRADRARARGRGAAQRSSPSASTATCSTPARACARSPTTRSASTTSTWPPATRSAAYPVGNTPDVLTDATADLAWALLMAAARRLSDAERVERAGGWSWEPDFLLGHDLHGATLGLIGMGRIGSAVARRALRLRHGGDPHRAQSGGVPLDELLERSDFVCIHAPLTPETRGLIDEDGAAADEVRARSSSTPRAGRSSTRTRWCARSTRAGSAAPPST